MRRFQKPQQILIKGKISSSTDGATFVDHVRL
jgi:hypothetical protein